MPENEAVSGASLDDLNAREAALPILWFLLERFVDNAVGHSAILAWMADRGEDEGGFLWLMGQLGCRPNVVESAIRIIISTPAQHRTGFRVRLQWAKRYRNGYEAS